MSAKEQLENFSIYSNKFFHNFHLSESSFTCPWLHTSGLTWRLLEEWYRLRQVSSLISGVIISLYLRTVQQCRLNAWACWAVAWGPMLIYVCCVRHVFNVLTLILLGTDHLTWRGGVYGFLFRSEFFFRTTQEFEYFFFLSCKARIWFLFTGSRQYDFIFEDSPLYWFLFTGSRQYDFIFEDSPLYWFLQL